VRWIAAPLLSVMPHLRVAFATALLCVGTAGCGGPSAIATSDGGLPLAAADSLVRTPEADLGRAAAGYRALLAAADWALAPEDSARVRRHLARLAPLAPALGLDGDLRTWPAGTGAAALRWWRAHDPAPSTVPNERLHEHLERGRLADAEYPNPHHPSGLDGRGRLLLRLGEPEWIRSPYSLTLALSSGASNGLFVRPEIWGYPSVSDAAVYLFARGVGGMEEVSVRELLPVGLQTGPSLARDGETGLIAQGLFDLLRPVAFAVPEYADVWDRAARYLDEVALASDGARPGFLPPDPTLVDLLDVDRVDREFRRRRAAEVPTTRTQAAGNAPGLAVDTRPLRFRQPDGSTRVELVWTLPPGALSVSPVEWATLSSLADADRVTGLDVSLTTFDADYEAVGYGQERLAVGAEAADEGLAPRVLQVRPLPPGGSLALGVEARFGDVVARRAVVRADTLAPLRLAGFEVSDALPVTLPAEQLAADPNELTLADYLPFAVTGGSLRRGDPLAVVFEVYGLTPGVDGLARYAVAYDLTTEGPRGGLAGLFGGRRERRAASALTMETEGGRVREAVAVDLSALRPDDDRVTLELRVTDEATGATVTRSLPLRIVE